MKRIFFVLVFVGLLAATGCTSNNEVAGLWVYFMDKGTAGTGEIRMELNDDGTANMSIDIPGTIDAIDDLNWKVEDGKLCLKETGNIGSGSCGEYAVDGDRMTYEMSGETLLFERWP